MPSLDLPDNLQVADKLQLFDIAYRRCPKDGSTPYVKMIICTGYYPKDADGNPVLNQLGFDKFNVRDLLHEFILPMNDPKVVALTHAQSAYNLAYRQFIIDHPEVPLMAVFDNFQTELGLQLYDKTFLHPEPTVVESPVVEPVLP